MHRPIVAGSVRTPRHPQAGQAMTLSTYAAWVRQADERTGNGSWAAAADPERELAYLGLGLTGEAGEVAEHIKKRLRDGNWDADAVADELGEIGRAHG